MRIGYACLTVGVPNTNIKSCILKNATKERLTEIVEHNLNSFDNILDYNIQNNIRLFRISSDIIPFASNSEVTISWSDIFDEKLSYLGEKAKKNGIRLSMHPGQYTVINSPNKDVVERAINDLDYHSDFLDSLGMESDSKIVLHIGGVYEDKKSAIERFVKNYKRLRDTVKNRLVIENDDKLYNIDEVLDIGTKLNIPVIYDNLHHLINHSDLKTDSYWINECNKTWKASDGCQKVHYSQQEPLKRLGSHSNTIRIQEFLDYYTSVKSQDIDIMLEVKDKNLSAVKCINSTTEHQNIKKLENEWSKYKDSVLEKSPENYNQIRNLLKNKKDYPVTTFYNLVDETLSKEIEIGKSINALQHVWGYFKDKSTEKENASFLKMIEKYENGTTSITTVKNYLLRMANKYQEEYLINSYYFDI